MVAELEDGPAPGGNGAAPETPDSSIPR